MASRTLSIVAVALRWLLGALFLWAGGVKLVDPRAFARTIDAFGLIPETLLVPVAILLPVLEIMIGISVVRRWRGGLPAMAILLVGFLLVLGYGLSQHLEIDCGCFSVAELQAHTSLKTAFVRDMAMLAGVIFLGFFSRCEGGPAPSQPH